MKQERIRKPKKTKDTGEVELLPRVSPVKHKLQKQIEKEMDELLEEIDSVLEENAEQFVANYVQKGGE